jgi:serine protease AprX
VAAAGNAGRRADGRTQYGAITAPGNAPWVLTVGASSHMGTIDRSDDTIAPFSSRGPTAIDRAAKPDLVAPGVGIESLSNPLSAMFITRAPYLINGNGSTIHPPYLSLSGTSQAAPAVAGTVALMLQANPALSPNAVKAILQYTAEAHASYDVMTQCAGFLNARGAIELSRVLASPATEPYPATAGWSRTLHWGNQAVQAGYVESNANAWTSDVAWGARLTPAGQAVRWGITCSTNPCDAGSTWIAWGTSCSGAGCSTVLWDRGYSTNVVWGTSCGGSDCSGQAWQGPPGEELDPGDTYIWGASDDDTIVWGTNDGDTIVWGTSDSGDTIVWGTSCADPSCTAGV